MTFCHWASDVLALKLSNDLGDLSLVELIQG